MRGVAPGASPRTCARSASRSRASTCRPPWSTSLESGIPVCTFRSGRSTTSTVADSSLAGLLAWYSIIHTPLDGVGAIFAEFRRSLRPGGHLLLGFHVGTGFARITRSYGHEVGIDLQLFFARFSDRAAERGGVRSARVAGQGARGPGTSTPGLLTGQATERQGRDIFDGEHRQVGPYEGDADRGEGERVRVREIDRVQLRLKLLLELEQ